MKSIIAKTNWENHQLYCYECKNKIKLGEKYLIEFLDESDDLVDRPLHLECLSEIDEEDYYENDSDEDF